MKQRLISRAVIIVNGPAPDLTLARWHLQPGDRVICADGGAQHAQAMGITPDVVIGDMDSITPALRADLERVGVRFIIHPIDKDETDLELALRLAITEGATEIDVLAVWGGRLDQSLANLLLLARPEFAPVRVRAVTDNEVVWPVSAGQVTTIQGAVGDTLSLIPLSPVVKHVTLTGVKWPLQDAILHFGSTWTMSNVLTEDEAQVQVGGGMVLVVQQQRESS